MKRLSLMSLVAAMGLVVAGYEHASPQSTAPAAAPTKKIDYPTRGRSITAIVPYAAGGSTGLLALSVSAALAKELGVPVQVINKGGGGTQVGTTEMARARPDGYTIGYIAIPTIINTYRNPKRQAVYTRASFQPVALLTNDPGAAGVRPESPYRSFKDLVEAAKARPEKVKVSTAGIGTAGHTMELALERLTGAKFAAVHFDGDNPATIALLGEHVDTQFAVSGVFTPYARDNRVRLLMIADSKRSPFFPDVPTAKEQGFDFTFLTTRAIVVPAETPREIVDVLAAATKRALTHPDVKQQVGQNLSQEILYMGPREAAEYWARTEAELGPVLDALFKD